AVGEHPAVPHAVVDSMAPAPGADLGHGSGDFTGAGEGAFVTEELAQERELVPPAVDEAAITARRSSAADIHLKNHHAALRIELEQPIGGPQPGVSTADDDHLGIGAAGQRRMRRRVAFIRQRLAEPGIAVVAGRPQGEVVTGQQTLVHERQCSPARLLGRAPERPRPLASAGFAGYPFGFPMTHVPRPELPLGARLLIAPLLAVALLGTLNGPAAAHVERADGHDTRAKPPPTAIGYAIS